MGTLNRFYGAFFGLAVGDAVGAQTRGAEHPDDVPLVDGPMLDWTDQTQHFTHAARAIVTALTHPYDRRVLGREVARELVDWYHDPSTPGRHPGRSSLQAVVRLLEGVDWETSGNPDSDGADPLPRAVAVGLAWAPDDVVEPAITVTSVTHLHPTALQASVIAAWLVSSVTRGARLDPELVEEACRLGASAVPQGQAVHCVLVALEIARRNADNDAPYIDPRAVPPGDCGHRCGSALGLAVLLALLFDGADEGARFERAIAAAAHIPGAPEVVGALTGALLGVALGLGVVPRDFVENTESRDDLAGLARALHFRSQGLGLVAERSGDEVDPALAWNGESSEFVSVSGGPPRSATDTEWTFEDPAEESATRRPRAGRHPIRRLVPQHAQAEGVEWIRVADEDLAEMEAADADLLAEVRRRW